MDALDLGVWRLDCCCMDASSKLQFTVPSREEEQRNLGSGYSADHTQ